jgi:DNA-binding NarL/FixJ family response regulator
VLVLSVSAHEADVTDAILVGAADYVLKEQPVEEAVAGIQVAAHGEPHISSAVAMQLMQRLREHEAEPMRLADLRLSARELEVLDLLAAGITHGEIAGALEISSDAVRREGTGILTKLVRTAVRAVRRSGG